MCCLNGLVFGIDVVFGCIIYVLKVDYRNWYVILIKFVVFWNLVEVL